MLATGTELRRPGEALEPGQIYEANTALLAAQLRSAGAEVELVAAVEDDETAHRTALEAGMRGDVLVTSGGVSVGPHDLVRSVGAGLGVEEVFWGVAVKPGKPLWFGVRGRTLVFGLPGNPVSALVGFEIFVRPALLALQGSTDPLPRFDPGRFLELLERHRVTVLDGAPPMLRVLAGHPVAAGADLGSLELLVCGGAPLAADAQRALSARLPGATVGQAWGLTETTVGLSMPDRDAGSVPGTVGRVMPNTELRVVDPGSGRDLAAGQPGELLARGPQVMAGYLHRPEATAAMVDPDGWLRTGDLGLVDGDGNVVIVDRLKELIKVSGHQVAPAELEALLATHPAVADAAVLRRPDRWHGLAPLPRL